MKIAKHNSDLNIDKHKLPNSKSRKKKIEEKWEPQRPVVIHKVVQHMCKRNSVIKARESDRILFIKLFQNTLNLVGNIRFKCSLKPKLTKNKSVWDIYTLSVKKETESNYARKQ